MRHDQKPGLVLSGGGAHAAYQAGVLKAISDLRVRDKAEIGCPFKILTGESAGAINATFLANNVHDFAYATDQLWTYWEKVNHEDIFLTSARSAVSIVFHWLIGLLFGGKHPSRKAVYLLDASPLKKFLGAKFDFSKVDDFIQSERLHGFAVSATHYGNGNAVSFFQGHESIEPWVRTHRIGKRAKIGLEHVLASASIPLLFPPIRLGDSFYGDGSIRMKMPISPAIHLGAGRVMAIGSHYDKPLEKTVEEAKDTYMESVSLTDIVGVIMNASFLDNMDADLERMTRINHTVDLIREQGEGRVSIPFEKIPILSIRPSQELASMACDQYQHFGFVLRFLLRGLGVSSKTGLDFLSYLAFDGAFTSQLLKLGYEDGMKQKGEILNFLNPTFSRTPSD